MAKDFRIVVLRKGNILHLKLIGEFDGISAQQVLTAIAANSAGVSRIFIHTGGLKCIYPFGRHSFLSNLNSISEKFTEFGVVGGRASELVLGLGK